MRSLLRYTQQTWGAEQRDRYADRLTRAMHELLEHPHLGPARDDVAPDLRQLSVGQHIIYYRILDSTISIIRILHRRMNLETHFHKPS